MVAIIYARVLYFIHYLFGIKHNTFISRILELRKGVSLCRKKERKNALQWVTDEHSCQFANEKSSISFKFFFSSHSFRIWGLVFFCKISSSKRCNSDINYGHVLQSRFNRMLRRTNRYYFSFSKTHAF